MIHFIKPFILGTRHDFSEEFAIPIRNGQHADSLPHEVQDMKEMSYILHKNVINYVQRRDVEVIKEYLPQKFEFVLFIPLTDIQEKLYEIYLNTHPIEGKNLLPDYTCTLYCRIHRTILSY